MKEIGEDMLDPLDKVWVKIETGMPDSMESSLFRDIQYYLWDEYTEPQVSDEICSKIRRAIRNNIKEQLEE